MSPRAVEGFAQRLEAMGSLIDSLPLPSRHNPDAFHERKSEIRKEFRKLCVEFRNSYGAPQSRSFPKVVEHSEMKTTRARKALDINVLHIFGAR